MEKRGRCGRRGNNKGEERSAWEWGRDVDSQIIKPNQNCVVLLIGYINLCVPKSIV